jgi:hypothetical protein
MGVTQWFTLDTHAVTAMSQTCKAYNRVGLNQVNAKALNRLQETLFGAGLARELPI